MSLATLPTAGSDQDVRLTADFWCELSRLGGALEAGQDASYRRYTCKLLISCHLL